MENITIIKKKGRPVKTEIGSLIASKGLTISEVAVRIGMSQSRLSHLLAKPQKIKAVDLYSLAAALGVEPSSIMDLVKG